MPCTQGAASNILRMNQNSELENYLRSRNRELEGMLCALLTELESERGESAAASLIAKASVCGRARIMGFWEDHKASDKKRLISWVDGLPENELTCIKVILELHEAQSLEEIKGIGEITDRFFALSIHERVAIRNILKTRQKL